MEGATLSEKFYDGQIDLSEGYNPAVLQHWKSMIKKCYSLEWPRQFHEEGLVCCPDWLNFSNFNNWASMFPDHTLPTRRLVLNPLFEKEKEYNPRTCLLVSPLLAHFLRFQVTKGMNLEDFISIIPAKGYKGLFRPKELRGDRPFHWNFSTPSASYNAKFFFLQPYPAKVYISIYNQYIKQLKEFQQIEEIEEVNVMLSNIQAHMRRKIKQAKNRIKIEAVELKK